MANTQLRFHLDEHLSPRIAAVLNERGIDTTSTQSAGLFHASDETQFEFAQRSARVFVTNDDDILKMASDRLDHAGIVFMSDVRTIGDVIEIVRLVAEDSTPDKMRRYIEFM